MENVLETLQEIMTEGGDNNYFILHLDDVYYMQFMCQKGNKDVYCEAVSNNFLEGKEQLNEAQEAQLLKLGWNANDNSNFSREVILDTPKALTEAVNWIGQTAKDVYGIEVTDDTEFTIELE